MKLILFPLLALSLFSQPQAVPVEIQPLAAIDSASPYASPRDAARHRFQHSLRILENNGPPVVALQGYLLAASLDPSYHEAVFNIAVISALEEKYEDAILAYEHVEGAAPALSNAIKPELERLRLIAKRNETPAGRRRLAFDTALAKVMKNLPGLSTPEAMQQLAETGKIDPTRWEVPALIAGIAGDLRQLSQARQLLTIAVGLATVPASQAKLKSALDYVERELSYEVAVKAAEAAVERDDYPVAAQEFEKAWTLFPSRSANAMEAAAAALILDQTGTAARMLRQAASVPGPDVTVAAVRMLGKLAAVEPEAKSAIPPAPSDPGLAEISKLSPMLPAVQNTETEILARESPRLLDDVAPVTLIDSLSREPVVAAAAVLPTLAPALPASGQRPMRELELLWKQRQYPAGAVAPAVAQADRAKNPKTARNVTIKSTPPGAQLFYDEDEDPLCVAPCTVRLSPGAHGLRIRMENHEDLDETVISTNRDGEQLYTLTPRRGSVLIESNAPAMIVVNDRPTLISTPNEIALVPGLYKIGLDFGGIRAERSLAVKPTARLRLSLPYPKQ